MTTETIDIRVREDGARVVRRNLEDIDTGARKAASGIEYLKKALLGLGVAALAREILQLIDTYQNLENRLRSTGLEGAALVAVQKDLLKISNETRSSVEGSTELYARLAISSKELGASQQQLIDFTKSLNQAIILSGASAQEAQAGLIQLSQGLASGVLRGDELRSVLEQLPAVADVIAKSMGVTRGELRQLGTDGKISAQTVLKAFKEARTELSERFAKTIPTLSQSFQVLKNNLMTFIGELDKSTGFSRLLSQGLFLLANNLDVVASAVVRLTNVLAVAAVGYGVFLAGTKARALLASASAALEFAQAVAAGNVVVLGSAEALRQQAVAATANAAANANATVGALSLARAQAAKVLATQQSIQATTADSVATARAGASYAASAVDRIRWTQAQLVAERELEVVRLAAQISDIGRMQSATRLAGIRKTELALTETLTAAETRSAEAKAGIVGAQAAQAAQLRQATAATLAARTAVTVAEKEALAATTALNTATAAGAAATAKAAGTTSLLGQAYGVLAAGARAAWGAVAGLFALLLANPFTALLIAITAVLSVLVAFRDKINLGVDRLTTLGDLLSVFADRISTVFKGLYKAAEEQIGPLFALLKKWFEGVDFSVVGVLRIVAKAVDVVVGLWAGAVRATTTIFEQLPPALNDIFITALNKILDAIGKFVNKAGELLSTVTEFAGLGKIESNLDFKLSNTNEGAAKQLGTDIGSAFKEGFNSANGASKFLEDAIKEAQGNSAARDEIARLAAKFPNNPSTVAGTPTKLPVDAKEVDKARNALRSLLDQILPSAGAVLELAKAQETLNNAQKYGLITAEQNIKYYALAKRYYEDIINPLGKINRELDEQTKLLQFNSHEREVESQLLQITKDLQQHGIDLTTKETGALRTKLAAIRDLNALTQAQDQIYADSIGKRQQFETQLVALQNMLSATGFTQGDAANATADILKNAGLDPEGTQVAIDAQIAQFQQMYTTIDALRQKDLISEQTANQLRTRVAIDEGQQRLKYTQQFFGTLASLSQSSNKRIAAIGKAAAVAQATIDGILAVQKALASAPPPYNYALAAAVGVTAAANVANIINSGYKAGGYTGNGAVNDVAGVVHGREFVVNAEGTARNRAALEAMNAGATLNGGGGGAQVVIPITVNNMAENTKVTTREKQGPNGKEIELMIETVVIKQVRNGGPIGNAVESQYGLNRAVGTSR